MSNMATTINCLDNGGPSLLVSYGRPFQGLSLNIVVCIPASCYTFFNVITSPNKGYLIPQEVSNQLTKATPNEN